MKVGLIGLSGSGKTTVFNALTGAQVTVGGGKKAEWNLGVIKVPDERIDRLAAIFKPKKTTYADIHFVDFAGVSTEQKGQGFSQQTIAQMRNVDALVLVVKGFDDGQPIAEAKAIELEMILSDLIVLEKRLNRLQKEGKKDTERDVLERCKAALEQEKPLRQLTLNEVETKTILGFQFLSLKPALLLVNVDESHLKTSPTDLEDLKSLHLTTLTLCGTLEAEIALLKPEEQGEFLADLGLDRPAKERFIQAVYAELNLISFLTVGEDEVRAWTIERGCSAVKAAGKIHSDIERGFIRAEVIPYQEFIPLSDLKKAKDQGKVRLEGKEYLIQDGEIIHFRFNV